MVLRHGHVVAEGWWAPHTPERTRLLYSISKSFTSTALAFAVEEGLLGLDDTVLDHFPEYADEDLSAYTRSTTLRHLASMASGHGREMWPEAVAADPRGTCPRLPGVGGSGGGSRQRLRLQPAVHLHGRGHDPAPDGAAAERVPPSPSLRPARHRRGGLALLPARARARVQRPVRPPRGRGQARPALPPARPVGRRPAHPGGVRRRGHVRPGALAGQDKADWSQGYGYCFWMARHGYRGDGAFGQFCIVLPEHDAVIAITGGTEAMQEVVDHVWEHLLPGWAAPRSTRPRRTPSTSGCVRSASRRARLTLQWSARFGRGRPRPGSSHLLGRRGRDGRLEITAAEPDNALTFPVGLGEWLTSEPLDAYGEPVPVAASGGWVDDDTLRVEVVFLETPHRLDVECSLAAGPRTRRGAPPRWTAARSGRCTVRASAVLVVRQPHHRHRAVSGGRAAGAPRRPRGPGPRR